MIEDIHIVKFSHKWIHSTIDSAIVLQESSYKLTLEKYFGWSIARDFI